MRKIPQSVREGQLNALRGKRFVRWLVEYKNNSSKAVMECDNGHEWAASVNRLLRGDGCPKCSGKYVYSAQEREQQLNSLPRTKFVRWASEYINGSSRAVVICPQGHEWAARASNLLRGDGCPKCYGNYIHSAAERETQLAELSNASFVRWDGSYRNCYSKAIMSCDGGHEWSASVNSLLGGRGCPKCAGVYIYSAAEREAQLDALPNMHFMRWDGEYCNKNSKAVMRCSEGHEWSASVDGLANGGSGCPACAKTGYDPAKPGTIYTLLHENGAHIKIGISNAHSRRLAELRRATPFKFEPIYLHHSDDGRVIADLEKVFHQNFESSGFSGFDGATEWLKFNPDILTIMRILGA